MPLYEYEAYSVSGKTMRGTIDAPSVADARAALNLRGLLPTVIKPASETSIRWWKRIFERKIDQKEILTFTKQLGVLLGSGVPLLAAVDLLSKQFTGRFHQILVAIKDDLSAGRSFAESLAKYPKLFSSVYVQLVRAGEASGKLENIMQRLHDYLASEAETRKRIKKAMAYPIFMLSFALVLTVVLLVGLVPMFAGMFTDMGIEKPPLTLLLLQISDFLKAHWKALIIGIVGTIITFIYWKSTPRGKQQFDRFLVWFPLTAYFTKIRVVVQFCKTLGMLLDAGVNLAEALDIVCNIVDNTVLVGVLKSARDNIIKQGKIAYYLEQTKIFPALASYMITTGEQSGELASMLLAVGHDYEVELADIIDGLIAKINPIMLMIVGGVVVLMVMGIFLPLFDAMGSVLGKVQ